MTNCDDADELLLEIVEAFSGRTSVGALDSMNLSALADAMRYLARRGALVILVDDGSRRVIASRTPDA